MAFFFQPLLYTVNNVRLFVCSSVCLQSTACSSCRRTRFLFPCTRTRTHKNNYIIHTATVHHKSSNHDFSIPVQFFTLLLLLKQLEMFCSCEHQLNFRIEPFQNTCACFILPEYIKPTVVQFCLLN